MQWPWSVYSQSPAMDMVVAGCTRQPHHRSYSGPCSTSYTHPVLPHRLHWGSAAQRKHAAQLRGSAAGVGADGCNLAGNTAHSRGSAPVSVRPRHTSGRLPVSTRVASPMAPTEAAREAEDDQPIDAEQPAPFERMADDADSAYSGLAGIVSADALYDVLDLRKELANFLREADKPLSAGLSGLQEIATSANWALPDADQQLIQAARLKHERELGEAALQESRDEDAEAGDLDDPAKFENLEEDAALTALVAKPADEAADGDQAPNPVAKTKEQASPAEKRRQRRAQSARRTPAPSLTWQPEAATTDKVLAQMHIMKKQKRAYLRPQTTDAPAAASNENPLAHQYINLAHKLLTRDEEQVLSKYIVEMRPYDVQLDILMQGKEQPPDAVWADACGFQGHHEAFFTKMRRCRQAKEIFEYCNLRMVAKIAHRYQGQGVEMEDLLAAGITGLQKAINRFDPTRGFKFSTYSHWWIRQTIQRTVIQHGRVIRLPGHLYDLRYKIRNAADKLASSLQRTPTDAEVAEHLNMPIKKVLNIKSSFRNPKSLELLDQARDTGGHREQNPISGILAEPPGDDDTPIPKSEAPAVQGDFERMDHHGASVVRAVIGSALSLLDTKERLVMRMRYGLDDGQPRTLEEIGRYFKVTRERVRQVEIRAFRKLKQAPKHGKLLDDAVNTSFMTKYI